MRRRQPTILITGFGPFPSVPVNASALLARRLGNLAARRFPGHRILTTELPVAWGEATERVSDLIARDEPRLVLSLGVSGRAKGFVIETKARNETEPRHDCRGLLPLSRAILDGQPAILEGPLAAQEVCGRLARRGLPAAPSSDAGRYLCNAVFFASLAACRACGPTALAAFVHIPESLAGAGRRGAEPRPGAPLTWEQALEGGLEIIRAALGRPEARRPRGRTSKSR